jgi:hypothetical protein
MLFDLQGKRRRVVQATYLMLALLMGGGLVFFGIGGDVSGGLFDAFSERGGGGGNGNSVIEERVESNEKKLQTNPRSEAVRKALVRDYYQLATAQTTDSSGGFPDEAKDELRSAAANWKAYLALQPKEVDASLAGVAVQIYDPSALNSPKAAQEAARLIAEAQNDSASYLRLVGYAALAGDNRTADLAGQKAVDLAPKAQRKEVEAQVEQLKKPQTAQTAQGAPPQQ